MRRPKKLEIIERPKLPPAKKTPNATCRDCQATQYVGKERYHSARPRCIACGGLLDIKPPTRQERNEARLRLEYSRL